MTFSCMTLVWNLVCFFYMSFVCCFDGFVMTCVEHSCLLSLVSINLLFYLVIFCHQITFLFLESFLDRFSSDNNFNF